MFAYIPARIGSKRIKEKNIYEVDGIPMIKHVIENLQNLSFIKNIYVSTDSNKIRKIVEELDVKVLGLRDRKLSDDRATFMELIKNDLPRFIDHTNCEEILFALPTAILVPPKVYNDAYRKYKKLKPEILIATEKIINPIWWAMEIKKNYLYPIFKDKVSVDSSKLKPTYSDAGLFYFFNQKKVAKYVSHKNARKILPYMINSNYTCDLNTMSDLEYLIYKYKLLKSKST